MSFFATITGAIGAAVNFVGGLVAKVGPAVSGFAKTIIQIASKIDLPKIVQIISDTAKIIHAVVDLLGIKSEDDPEVLGAKAEQSDKKMEDFDNDVEAYIKYLKEEVQLDMKKFEQMNEDEKLGCKAVGLSLETKAVEQKIGGVHITPEFVGVISKIQEAGIAINGKDLLHIIQVLKNEGITNLNDVVDYLKGKGNSDRIKTGEVLHTALGQGADKILNDLKNAVRKDL